MIDLEMIQAMRAMMKEELEPINKRLDAIEEDITTMKEDIEIIKEDAEITRTGVNSLLNWAEECGNVIKFPLPKIAEA